MRMFSSRDLCPLPARLRGGPRDGDEVCIQEVLVEGDGGPVVDEGETA
jgi:hypothetical protein